MIIRKMIGTLFVGITMSILGAKAQTVKTNDGRDSDRAAIFASISDITKAFIDGDTDKIYATHAKDWSGFLERTKVPIRGVDDYMKANGLTYPTHANAVKPTPNPIAAKTGFKISNFSVDFYAKDVGVASFTLDFGKRSETGLMVSNRLRIMDVYAKRDGGWIQVASHTVVDPSWFGEQTALPATNMPSQIKQRILSVRESVWKAFFANDVANLESMIPDEALAYNPDSDKWETRAAILSSSAEFAKTGAKLTRLEFPHTEMQAYGPTIILYSSYLYETEKDGKKVVTTGNGMETFVLRNEKFVNTGWLLSVKK